MGASDTNPQVLPEGLRVLWSGFDTVEVTLAGGVTAKWAERLDRLKREAQDTGHPAPVELDGESFGVNRSGLKPFAWLLTNPDLHLRVGRGKPAASVRLLSVGLAAVGMRGLLATAYDSLEAVGGFGRPRVSRADLSVDFQGWEPPLGFMVEAVCPASFRPVYPNVQAPESYQYGRGDVVVRVYNKTIECQQKPSHWPGVWAGVEGYDPERDVWRVEVQYRGGALREMGVHTPDDLLRKAVGVFRYGLEWLSVRVPSESDTHRDRWPVHPVWAWLHDSWGVAEPVSRCRESLLEGSALGLMPQIAGLLVSMGAHLGLHDPGEVVAWVMRSMGHMHADRGEEFSRLVERRQLDLYGIATPDGLPPAWNALARAMGFSPAETVNDSDIPVVSVG